MYFLPIEIGITLVRDRFFSLFRKNYRRRGHHHHQHLLYLLLLNFLYINTIQVVTNKELKLKNILLKIAGVSKKKQLIKTGK
jgi:hypothetical protein